MKYNTCVQSQSSISTSSIMRLLLSTPDSESLAEESSRCHVSRLIGAAGITSFDESRSSSVEEGLRLSPVGAEKTGPSSISPVKTKQQI